MAGESNPKRVFPADIFAEDNDKWLWSTPSFARNNAAGSINQSVLKKLTEHGSESSNSSVGESSNVQILERSFRKRSNSNSNGNPAEDASSSSGPATYPPERVLPSMYDDDARSASPSTYEKKDLAYASSFLKEFNPLPPKNLETGSFMPFGGKSGEPKASDKEERSHSSKEMSPSPSTSSKNESKRNQTSRSRSHSRDGRSPRGQSGSHGRGRLGRSPGRDLRSRSRERYPPSRGRRSRSREGGRSSSHSRDYRRRSRSRSRDLRRRSRSRGREHRRSRSRSRDYRRSRSRSYERRRGYRRSSSRDYYKHRRYSRSRSRSRDRSKKRAGSGNRKPGSLPLSTPGGSMTPQMALQQTMAAMSAKAEAITGVSFPKYYNPAAVNPLKYAEQVQKRKLLWQKDTVKVEEPSKNTVWDKLQFAQDQDGKMTAKFRKLMGIKSKGATPAEEKESVLKKQEELFRDLDQQYEMARMTTHTQRGVGLGYTAPPAAALYPPVQK